MAKFKFKSGWFWPVVLIAALVGYVLLGAGIAVGFLAGAIIGKML